MHQLEFHNYSKVKSLVADLNIHLAVEALLRGDSSGKVYVDDLRNPKSVFAHTMARYFLSGRTDNKGFNVAVNQNFERCIYPAADLQDLEGFSLFFQPNAWRGVIAETILINKFPLSELRCYFEFSESLVDWRSLLPGSYKLFPVDEYLLGKRHLRNLDLLLEEMKSERPTSQAFLERNFGYCLVYDGSLVSWCLSEYNSQDRIELGIETQPGFQRRGLATIVASAVIEKALSQGITQIGWHCFARNHASIATAEKVGFQKVAEYPAYWALFDSALNLAVNGNACIEREDFREAVDWFNRAISGGDVPAWVFWNAACAYAHLNEKTNSFQYLNQAVDKGFTDLDYINNSQHFAHWHETPEWTRIIARLEAMQAGK